MTSKVALLDGDLIGFRCAAAAQEEFEGDILADVPGALDSARKMVASWTEKAGCARPILCLSQRDGANFRKEIGPYKEARDGGKPEAYWPIIDLLEEEFSTMRIPKCEGDDVIGILHTSEKFKGRSVMVSIDKDMQTIPGRWLDPDKHKKPKKNPPAAAHAFWMFQTLTGDVVDGYPGCPGVGAKGAEAILQRPCRLLPMERRVTRGKRKGELETKWVEGDPCDLWSAIVDRYHKAGLTEDDAVLQARFARILQRSDYDREKETITLWHPRKPEVLSLV